MDYQILTYLRGIRYPYPLKEIRILLVNNGIFKMELNQQVVE